MNGPSDELGPLTVVQPRAEVQELGELSAPPTLIPSQRSGEVAPSLDAGTLVALAEAIALEYLGGLSAVSSLGSTVTVFGSARTEQSHRWYEAAYQLGFALAENGFCVVTGGGPGIMAAANYGAKDAGGSSVGLAIRLPFEQPNEGAEASLTFSHFPARKTALIEAASAVVVFPGGFGSLDELFEVMTLVQNAKIDRIPIVLVDSQFWTGLVLWMRQNLELSGTISPGDLDLLTITDDVHQVVDLLVRHREG